MVGFIAAVNRLLGADALRKAVADSLLATFQKLNPEAFDKGFGYGGRPVN